MKRYLARYGLGISSTEKALPFRTKDLEENSGMIIQGKNDSLMEALQVGLRGKSYQHLEYHDLKLCLHNY